MNSQGLTTLTIVFTYFMFSRLLKSARSFLIDTPQIETISPAPVPETIEETMVTTRRKQVEIPVDDDLDENQPISVDVPTSSKKRSRRARPEDTPEMSAQEESVPPSTKKRKTLPLREREAESPEGDMEDFKEVKTHPVVEIPARKATPPKGQISGVKSVGSLEKREEQQDVVSKKTHKRFGSEDLDEEFFSTARDSNEGDAPIVLSDDESEESDDDAPEAIGIQEAARTIKSKDRDAAKVVKEQLAATRKKRQQRDDALKKQSESSKKRKIHDTEKEPSIGANVDVAVRNDAPNLQVEPDAEDEEIYAGSNAENEAPAGASIPLPRFIANRNTLPELLPAEYLEDTEPREMARVDEQPTKKSKKTKFQDPTVKEPRDRRIGATTYRVTKPQSTNLAPKASFQARSTKEKWLQGRVGKNEQSSRKPFFKGFVKK